MKKLISIVICSSLIGPVWAQNQSQKSAPDVKLKKEQRMNRLREQMAKDRERIRELLGVDMLGDVSKRFEELMEKFHGNDMGSFFQDDNFNQFLDDWDPFEGLSQGSSHWMETPKERILILKYKAPKDSPIDVKIEKGRIQIKGTNEEVSEIGGVKTKSVSTFNQIYTLPGDVDGAKATFENKDGEILVKFPKLKPGKVSAPSKTKPTPGNNQDDRQPIAPSEGDITI